MRIRLHEVELFSKDPAASRAFYKDILGVGMTHQEDGLNVFDSGWPGVDFDTSRHLPGKTRIGFVVDDLQAFLESLQGKNVKVEGPMDSHLGMRIVRLHDPDGHIVEVQEFSEGTPPPVRAAFAD